MSIKQVLKNLNTKSAEGNEVSDNEIKLTVSSPSTVFKGFEVQHWENALEKRRLQCFKKQSFTTAKQKRTVIYTDNCDIYR